MTVEEAGALVDRFARALLCADNLSLAIKAVQLSGAHVSAGDSLRTAHDLAGKELNAAHQALLDALTGKGAT